MVAHTSGGRGVASSSLVIPTNKGHSNGCPFSFGKARANVKKHRRNQAFFQTLKSTPKYHQRISDRNTGLKSRLTLVAFGRFLDASHLHTHYSIRLSHQAIGLFLFIRSYESMEKLITTTSQITTAITSNTTGKNTYAIERTLSNVKGDTAIIVLLYPTISSTRPFSEDSTLLHLTRHMAEMKLNRIVIINLFSTVCRSRLSTRGIKVDENNLRNIEKIITEKKKEHSLHKRRRQKAHP